MNNYSEKRYFSMHENLSSVLAESAGRYTVVIPAGVYETGPVDVPSDTRLVLEEGAVLSFSDDFDAYPPVYTRWEGVDCWAMHPCFMINGASNVRIEGKGVLNGNGKKWWDYIRKWKAKGYPAVQTLPIEKALARLNPDYRNQPGGGGGRPCQFLRPALFQIYNSKDVSIEGLTLTMSPFWTCHPVCSQNIVLRNLIIENPADSPNTDGIDIESCSGVTVCGCSVHVGDDGIAVKSGSGREMINGPSSGNILVEDCVVSQAHGGFVIGSETASGINGATVRNCRFLGTDRGLRIKTRRDRGGVIENITLENVYMENVICPVSVNMYYNCGSDSPSLFSLKALPVTEVTPLIRNITVKGIEARGIRRGAALLVGLPERPLENVSVTDCRFELAPVNETDLEMDMMAGIPDSDYRGVRTINADLHFDNITINTEPAVRFDSYNA